jgi:hypothetical protein
MLLWRLTAKGKCELYDEIDPLSAIATLAAKVAHDEGWHEQEELWIANQGARSSRGEEAA